jgi:hypothetical protein
MSEIKEGDYVIVTKFDFDTDHKYFEIGKAYRVRSVRKDKSVHVDHTYLQLLPSQIMRRPEDNALNRLLYPEIQDWSKK